MRNSRREALGGLIAAAGWSLGAQVWAQTAPTDGALGAGAPGAGPPAAGADAEPNPDNEPSDQIGSGQDKYSRITAPVFINGQGPFRFMLDTGANFSVVARKLSERLAAPVQEGRMVHTVVGVRRQPIVLLDELMVGKRRRRRVSAVAVNIVDPGVDGILGIDWLDGRRLILDFANERVEFTASVKEKSETGSIVVPARRRLGQLTIVDAELGETKVNAMIDSGSEVSLCNTPLLKLLDSRSQRERGLPADRYRQDMISVLGERYSGELVYLPFLKLASLQLGNVPVVHSDTHVFRIWGLEDKPAILMGMDLLRQFRAVSLDFGRSHVRFDLSPQQI